jgi:transcriptional regulator with GAF, ATPase, and Fis domain
VLLATGNMITDIGLPELQKKIFDPAGSRRSIKTIEENERDHIISALRSCNGKISGEGGAAELLKIHVSTLNSRIKKLGIKREHYFTVDKY